MRSDEMPAQSGTPERWTLPPVIPERRFLRSPPVGRNVWPGQCCPRFGPRASETLNIVRECWFCRFADLHLDEPYALDVGICCYR